MQEKYIRDKDVPKYISIGKTKFNQIKKHSDFPKKINLGNAVVYVVEEIDDWMLSQRERESA